MKQLVITFFAITAFAVGCKPSAEQDCKGTAGHFDKVRTETNSAVQEMKDYTYAQKAEFTKEMRSQLATINRELDQLAVKIGKSSDSARAEAKPKLLALREKAEQVYRHLDEAWNATESTWESVKTISRQAYNDLKDGFNQSRQWVSDKIAP